MFYSGQGLSYYTDAKAKGKKEYRHLKARGASGHLSSLDGLLKDVEIVGTVDLGVQEIALKRVVGTYYNSRRIVFSKGFLPLEAEDSEFGSKWIALCEAHLDQGIHDPIKVYEYLNYYYVMEGNKRVSVLKYFNGTSISAQVYRLLPRYDANEEDIVLYYAFLEFYKRTRLSNIWMSKPTRFERLLSYLEDYDPQHSVHRNKYEHFYHQVYVPFRPIYLKEAEASSPHTTGDAFLLYAKLYKIPETLDRAQAEKVMPHLISELRNYGSHESVIKIQTSPEDIPKSGFLDALNAIILQKKLKVGFVYARTVEASGWTYAHDLGRQHLETVYKDQVTTDFIDNVPEGDEAYPVICAFAQSGFDVIFSTSEVFRHATLRCAIENPDITFFTCSGNRPYMHMSNYFGRTYEPRFLAGMIAGAMTQTRTVGYAATAPNPEVISSINSFALGMKMVNPHSKLVVTWSGEWNDPNGPIEKSDRLIARGADIVSNKNLLTPMDVTRKYGVYSMLCAINPETGRPGHYLAAPIWNWGRFYQKIIESVLSGSYQKLIALNSDENQLHNFWWGIDSGVLDLNYSADYIPRETVRLVEVMKKLLVSEQFHPFSGPLIDRNGILRVAENTTLSPGEILEMDWYLDNVEIIDEKD